MYIVKRFIRNSLRPIISVMVLDDHHRPHVYRALVDTGAMHFVWCSSRNRLLEAGFKNTRKCINITGINDNVSMNVQIYCGNMILCDSGSDSVKSILAFDNVEIVHSEMLQDEYDMIIPYSFLIQFNTVFLKPTDKYNRQEDRNLPADTQNNIKFGALGLMTDSDRNVYSLENVNSKVVGLKDGDANKFSILIEALKVL